MTIRKFTVVGGGSAYAPGLFAALLHHRDELGLEEVRLFDTHTGHLEVVSRLCQRMAESQGARLRVRASAELPDAVRGVDAVLHTTRPGGFACRRVDEALPVSLGMPGQETVGPGGFFFALRSVPVALGLARTMATHCPQAILLNYTNPTNIVTQALVEAGDVQVLGLCDQSDEDLAAVAEASGLPHAPLDFRCVGLNHATWYTDVTFDGRPLPRVDPKARAPAGYDQEHQVRFALSARMAAEHPGWWPNSYLPYYLWPDRFVELSRQVGFRTDAILAKLDGYFTHFAEEAAKSTPDLRHHRGTAGFGDMAVNVLRCLGAETPRPVVLNVPNRGLTGAFAPDTVVEARVRLSQRGVERTPCPPAPEATRPLMARLEAYQRATARAALAVTWASAEEALALNPLVGSGERARALLQAGRAEYGEEVPLYR